MDSVRTCMFGLCAFLGICVLCLASPVAADEKAADRVVVAGIGDVLIYQDELARRLLQEMRPHEEQFYQEPPSPTAESVLRKIDRKSVV